MKIRDLFVRIGFDVDDKAIKQLDKGVNQLKTNIKRVTVAFAAAGAGLAFFVREAGKLEQTEIAFTTMLGSAEKAKEVLADLYDLVARTPFRIHQVEENARTLLAMGIEVDNLIPTMKMLGDVASGLSRPLWRIALNFGQVKTQSKLTGRELRDFAVLGVPIIEELAKSLNTSKQEIQAMVSRGEIGFPEVEKAFKDMTSEGGRFANMMFKQSKSLFGLWSILLDFLTLYSRQVGKTLLPQAKKMVAFAIDFLKVNEKLIKTKAVEFFRNVAKAMEWAFKVAKGMVITIKEMADMFGGLERVIKAVVIAMGILWGAQMLMGIGNILMGINKTIIAYSTLGKAALFAQLKMLAMPLLIGIAIAALIIIIQDLKGYFEGKDSVTGLILEAFEQKFPVAFEKTMIGLRTLKQTFIDLGKLIASVAFMLWGLVSFDWERIKVGATEFGKILAPAAGMTGIPALAGGAGAIYNQAKANVNANITVNVPAGTPPEEVGSRVQAGIKDVFSDLLLEANLATGPRQE